MGQFASDAFAGTSGNTLQTYSASWTKISGDSDAQISNAGRVRLGISTSSVRYYHSATPASADYSVSADIVPVSSDSGQSAGVAVRMSTSATTFYFAQGVTGTGVRLYKVVAGSFTQLGSTASYTFTTGTPVNIKIEAIGTAIKVYMAGSGTATISQTDSGITAANRPGISMYGNVSHSDTVGFHLDNWSADEGGGATNHSLTASNIAGSSPVISSGTLTQAHVLTASNVAGSAPTLGSPALTQNNALTASGIAGSAPTLASPGLTQAHVLTGTAIAGSSPVLGSPALTLEGTLIASDVATGAPTLQAPALTQTHVLTASNIASAAPTLGSPALTQAQVIAANNLSGTAPTLGTPALSVSGDTYALAATALVGSSPSAGSPALTQNQVLSATALLWRLSGAVVASVGPGSRSFRWQHHRQCAGAGCSCVDAHRRPSACSLWGTLCRGAGARDASHHRHAAARDVHRR